MDVAGIPDSPARTRKAYARKACNECRRHKIRCLPGPDQSETCLRCHRMKEQCVFIESKKPQKRRLLNSRVRQLEQNIEDIKSLLESSRDVSSARSPTTPPSTQKSNLSGDGTDTEIASDQFTVPMYPSSTRSEIQESDAIDDGILTIQEAQGFLLAYLEMAHTCPFVAFPKNVPLENLRNESPLLLHAIFVAASTSRPYLQIQINRKFLTMLSSRAILVGQKSLELLQALLIYLCWYHVIHEPGKQRAIRLVGLAVSICQDLGIYRPHKRSEQEKMNIETAILDGLEIESSRLGCWPHSARRAFVGCYFLASTFCVILRRPPLMPYTDFVGACAASLASEERAPTDVGIPSYLEFARHTELVCEMFGYRESHPVTIWTSDAITPLISSFSARIESWKKNKRTLKSESTIKMECAILEAFTREVALYSISRQQKLSIASTKILVECLVHIKRYLDEILKLPTSTFLYWTSPEWAWHNYMQLLALRVSVGVRSDAWNMKMARQIFKPEEYMEAILVRMRELGEMGLCDHAWHRHILAKFESYKAQYKMALDKASGEETPGQQEVDACLSNELVYSQQTLESVTPTANLGGWTEDGQASRAQELQPSRTLRSDLPGQPLDQPPQNSLWQMGPLNVTSISAAATVESFYGGNFCYPAFLEDEIFSDPTYYSPFSGLDLDKVLQGAV